MSSTPAIPGPYFPIFATVRKAPGQILPIKIVEMTDDHVVWWGEHISRPLRQNPDYGPEGSRPRADRSWRWRRMRFFLPLYMKARGHSTSALTILVEGKDGDAIPAALMLLIQHYPFVRDPEIAKSVFTWFITAAPHELLSPHTRTGATPALGDIMVEAAIALSNSDGNDGRMWLHAAPGGGDALLKFYTACDMERLPAGHKLPNVWSKMNDGRYFAHESRQARDLREQLAELLRRA